MEKNVLSVEQCRHLQGLGLDMSDAAMYWVMCVDRDGEKKRPVLNMRCGILEHCLPEEDVTYTYTFQELWDSLPKAIEYDGELFDLGSSYSSMGDIFEGKGYEMAYTSRDGTRYFDAVRGKDWMDTAYGMMCWVLENGLYRKEE